MTEILPFVLLSYGDDGLSPVIAIGEQIFSTWEEIVATVPAVLDPQAAAQTAGIVSHLAYPGRYEVIEDPAAFEAAYMAQIEREDPAQPWQQGVTRLRDFGIPDFTTIAPPVLEGGRLRAHMRDTDLGVPYLMEAEIGTGPLAEPAFEPLPLTRATTPAPATPDPMPEMPQDPPTPTPVAEADPLEEQDTPDIEAILDEAEAAETAGGDASIFDAPSAEEQAERDALSRIPEIEDPDKPTN